MTRKRVCGPCGSRSSHFDPPPPDHDSTPTLRQRRRPHTHEPSSIDTSAASASSRAARLLSRSRRRRPTLERRTTSAMSLLALRVSPSSSIPRLKTDTDRSRLCVSQLPGRVQRPSAFARPQWSTSRPSQPSTSTLSWLLDTAPGSSTLSLQPIRRLRRTASSTRSTSTSPTVAPWAFTVRTLSLCVCRGIGPDGRPCGCSRPRRPDRQRA